MKVIISLTRETDYSAVVEMSANQFRILKSALESGDPSKSKAREKAEREINKLIEPDHWQDDSLTFINQFDKFTE